MTSVTPLSIFIGMTRERGRLPRVLIESLYQHSSAPLAITPLVTLQLESECLYRWERDPKQIKEFFTHLLVPNLMVYKYWAIFIGHVVLCCSNNRELCGKSDDRYSASA